MVALPPGADRRRAPCPRHRSRAHPGSKALGRTSLHGTGPYHPGPTQLRSGMTPQRRAAVRNESGVVTFFLIQGRALGSLHLVRMRSNLALETIPRVAAAVA